MEIAICMDCNFAKSPPDGPLAMEFGLPNPVPENFICKHFQPSYWEGRGYKRNWGDAAVMMWPRLEILRGTFEEPWGRGGTLEKITRFVILAPLTGMRRPVVIETKDERAWGSF